MVEMALDRPDSGPDSAADHHSDEHQRRFVDAALTLLREHEPAKISMGDIAHEAGVSRSLAYVYFEDRDAVLVAAFLQFFANMQAQVDTVLYRSRSQGETLREIVRIYLGFARDNAGQFRHVLDGGLVLLPPIRAARREQFARLATILGGTSDARIIATMLVTVLENAALAWLDEGADDLDSATDLVWNFAWNGLSRPASG